MATRPKARKTGSVRAWVLIRFHKPVQSSLGRLKRVEVAPGWPGGASVMRLDRVKPIKWGKKRIRRYHSFAEIHAADRPALHRILTYLEQNFSHMDVYEF